MDDVLEWLKQELNVDENSAYLQEWIAARGNIMDVVVEALDIHSDKNILSREERELVETYRCLSKAGKAKIVEEILAYHDEECKQRNQG